MGAHLFGCEGPTNGSHNDSSNSSNREFLLFGEEAVALDVLLQVEAVEEPARQRRVETQATTNEQTNKRTNKRTNNQANQRTSKQANKRTDGRPA